MKVFIDEYIPLGVSIYLQKSVQLSQESMKGTINMHIKC
jgi:hypothetical protein